MTGCFDFDSDPQKGFLSSVMPVAPYAHSYPQQFDLKNEELPRPDRVLRMGVVPAIGSKAAADRYAPVAEHLSKSLNVEFQVSVGASYGDLVEQFVRNEVDLLIVPSLSYLEAYERVPGMQPIVSKIALGSPSYSSFLVVRKEDPIRHLKDLRGRRIAMVHENSTSGFLFPYAALLDAGIDPQTDFKEVIFAGSHPRSLALVAMGRVDVAATSSGIEESISLGKEMMKNEIPGKEIEWKPLRILRKVGRIPYDVVCARPEVPSSTVDKIRKVLLELNTRSAEGHHIWHMTQNITGWLPFDNSRYDGVREVRKKVQRHIDRHGGISNPAENEHGR